jgi:two-component system response regulator RegA
MTETAVASRTLLVVDDDAAYRTRLVRALAERGLSVTQAGSYDEAVQSAEAETPEMALVDLRLPGRSGLDVVKRLKELDSTTSVVVLTGYGSIATAVESVRLGATTYLTKPVDADQILAALDGIMPATEVGSATPSLARVEWEHIQRVMADVAGNISEAARRLGIHRRSLQRKLAKYPVRESE